MKITKKAGLALLFLLTLLAVTAPPAAAVDVEELQLVVDATPSLQYKLARNGAFITRVEMMMIRFAQYVKGTPGVGDTHRADWLILADKIIADSGAKAQRMAILLVGHPNVIATIIDDPDHGVARSTITDAALQPIVEGLWDMLAREGSLQ